jgi:ribonuclease E
MPECENLQGHVRSFQSIKQKQLDALYSPTVTLPSGGYIVNQTEALVSVDINSGKATREHNIEIQPSRPTLKPAMNRGSCACAILPALVVIDFIDMERTQ